MNTHKHPLIFSPGPTMVSHYSLNQLASPPIHHRTHEFSTCLQESFRGLKYFFQTQNHVFCLNATGTGALEACIVNSFPPESPILCLDGGKFGERWANIAETYGCQVDRIKLSWGQAFDFEVFKTHLQRKTYKAFLIQACETSTATAYPIAKISSVLKEIQPNCFLYVDGITAVGCMDLKMDRDSIDGLVCGSQKSLGLTTGLSFASFSPRAWSTIESCPTPRFYFDLIKEYKDNQKGFTHFSSPVNSILSLNQKLQWIQKIGLESFYQKTQILNQLVQKFLTQLGCEIFSQSPSPSVTAFYLPQRLKTSSFQKTLLEKGLFLAGGQGPLKGHILRWGHMGEISSKDLIQAFSIFIDIFKEQNIAPLNEEVSVLNEIQNYPIIDKCLLHKDEE